MNSECKPFRHPLLGDLQILLHGVPCRSSRGWFGYCSIVLMPLEKGWALFDTGHFSDRFLLLQVLKEIALSPEEISHIIISHLHFDHILNIPLFKNASLVVAGAEVEYAQKVMSGEMEDNAIPDNWQSILNGREIQRVDGPIHLDEKTQLDVFPGHTPGGLVVYRQETSTIAICGDVIKNAWDALTGEPSAAGFDAAQGRNSIKRVLERAEIIIPGHDRPFCMRDGALEFLSPFSWQVRGHLFPRPQDEVMLDINLAGGSYKGPEK